MKTWLTVIATVVLASGMMGPAPADAQEKAKAETKVCTLKVTGMTCGGCEAAVRGAARRVAGVTDVKVSYAKGSAEVTYDPRKTTPEAIAKVITQRSGFKAVAEPESKK